MPGFDKGVRAEREKVCEEWAFDDFRAAGYVTCAAIRVGVFSISARWTYDLGEVDFWRRALIAYAGTLAPTCVIGRNHHVTTRRGRHVTTFLIWQLTLERDADGKLHTVTEGKGDASKDIMVEVFRNGRLLVGRRPLWSTLLSRGASARGARRGSARLGEARRGWARLGEVG